MPDLLVFDGDRLWLLEVKTDVGHLTAEQEAFIVAGWPVCVVENEAAALRLFGVNL